MNAIQKIKNALKGTYDEGRVNAMDIHRGYAVDTGRAGWHLKEFGRSEHVYLGRNVKDAVERIEDSRG